MKKHLSVTVGIFQSQYTASFGTDGSVTVRAPYVKWKGDSGSLAFRKESFDGEDAIAIKAFFDAGELAMAANNGSGALTLEDVLCGNRMAGVRVTGILK